MNLKHNWEFRTDQNGNKYAYLDYLKLDDISTCNMSILKTFDGVNSRLSMRLENHTSIGGLVILNDALLEAKKIMDEWNNGRNLNE